MPDVIKSTGWIFCSEPHRPKIIKDLLNALQPEYCTQTTISKVYLFSKLGI